MKYLFLFVLTILTGSVIGQQVVQIIEPQDISLKGETKAMFGGKAKSAIEIELPMGTQMWFYAFSAREQGETKVSIDLKKQVEDMIASGNIDAKKVELPSGSLDMNFYMLDPKGKNRFMETQTDFGLGDYGYYDDYSIERRTVGAMEVDLPSDHTWFLGIKNPNSMENGIVHIDVVAVVGGAIVESATVVNEKEKDDQKKAELYGNLAYKKIEAGDYSTALEYCDKSTAISELGWVEAHRGLAQLMSGKGDAAIDTYLNAIDLIKEQPDSETKLKEQLERVKATTSGKEIDGAEEVIEIIQIEL